MRNRVLLLAGATALVAASCAQPEPQVLSEAPRSASAAEVTSPTTTERDEQPGKFIARCATEADGGTPGMTFFTDGTQNVTDHCLSRYYIGVQPAPGALYVPDEEAGTYAPPSETTPVAPTGTQWTPAQPRTDTGSEDDRDLVDGDSDSDDDGADADTLEDETTEQPDETDPEAPLTDDPDAPANPTDETSPTTPPATEPGETEPGDAEPTTPGTSTPGTTGPDETSPSGPGSTEETSVPTTTGVSRDPQPGALTSVTPADSSGSIGPENPQAPSDSGAPAGFPGVPWPGSFWPGGPQS